MKGLVEAISENLTSKDVIAAFFSDLHLGLSDDPRFSFFIQELLQLEQQENLTHLFFLGDIFDLWIGSGKTFQKEYAAFIEVIRKFSKKGIQIYYCEGNHDFHIEDVWLPKEVKIFYSRIHLKFSDNTSWLLEHGDLMDTSDKGYLFLRSLLRSFFVRVLVKIIPSFLIYLLGNFFSKKSRRYTTFIKFKKKKNEFQKKTRKEYANKVISDYILGMKNEHFSFDFLICGHLHERVDKILNSHIGDRKVRVFNLGSWLGKNRQYLFCKEKKWSWRGESYR